MACVYTEEKYQVKREILMERKESYWSDSLSRGEKMRSSTQVERSALAGN